MDKFGGLSPFADALGVPTSTAFSWKHKGYIPAWRQPAVLSAAIREGVDLATTDFPPAKKRLAA